MTKSNIRDSSNTHTQDGVEGSESSSSTSSVALGTGGSQRQAKPARSPLGSADPHSGKLQARSLLLGGDKRNIVRQKRQQWKAVERVMSDSSPPSSFKRTEHFTRKQKSDFFKYASQWHAQMFGSARLSHSFPGLDGEGKNILREWLDNLSSTISGFKTVNVSHNFEVGDNVKEMADDFATIMRRAIIVYAMTSKFEGQSIFVVRGLLVGYVMIKGDDIDRAILAATLTLAYYFKAGVFAENDVFDSDDNEMRSQMEEYVTEISIQQVATTCASLALLMGLGKQYSVGSISGMMRDIGGFPRFEEGVGSLVEKLFSFLNKVVDYVNSLGFCPPIKLRKTDNDQVNNLIERIDCLCADFNAGAEYSWVNAQTVNDLATDLRKVQATLPRHDSNHRLLEQAARAFNPIHTKMQKCSLSMVGQRVAPLGVLIGGPSGVGKSTLTSYFLIEVLSRTLPETKHAKFEANYNDCVYNYISERKFMDNYRNQEVIILDDFGQVRDIAGTPNEDYMAAIRLINTNEYMANMADLSDKGQTYVRCDLVYASTNLSTLKADSIHEPTAVIRRFTEAVWIVPKPEFCINKSNVTTSQALRARRLDHKKLKHGEFDKSIYEVYNWDYSKGEPIGKAMSYQEFVDKVVGSMVLQRDHNAKLIAGVKAFQQKVKPKWYAMYSQGGEFEWPAREAQKLNISERTIIRACREAGIITYEDFNKSNLREELKLDAADCVSDMMSVIQDPDDPHPILKFLFDNKVAICSVIAMAPLVYFAYKQFAAYVGQSGEMKSVKGSRQRKSTTKSLRLSPQIGLQQANAIRAVFANNLYTIHHHDVPNKFGYFLFVRGHCGILPNHILMTLQSSNYDSGGFYIKRCSAPDVSFPFGVNTYSSVADFDEHGNTQVDLAIVRFPTDVIQAHRDITSYLSDDDFVPNSQHSLALCTSDALEVFTSKVCSYRGRYNDEICEQTLLRYGIGTKVGDCGAPLFYTDKGTIYNRIQGIHVAGNGHTGASIRVTKSLYLLMEEAVMGDEMVIQVDFPFEDIPNTKTNIVPIAKGKQPFVPATTKLTPSALHDVILPHTKMPAMLKPTKIDGVLIDPMKLTEKLYSRAQPYINVEDLEVMTACLVDCINDRSVASNPWPPRLFSFEEAVAGVPGQDYCNGIPRNTSPGWPYNTEKLGKGKTAFFGEGGEYSFDSSECTRLRGVVNNVIDHAIEGKRLLHVCSDTLKDELRPIEKVKLGKTRKFAPVPVHLLIAFRMYFGDLVRWLMANRLNNFQAIGINPYSEWDTLAKNLLETSDMVFDGDFSCFDGSLPIVLMMMFLRLSRSFYANGTEEDHRVREVLFQEVVNSRHIIKGVIYEFFGSNPSGGFLTTPLNGFCNVLACMYASYQVNKDLNAYEYSREFLNSVYSVTFGDDGVSSVKEEFIHRFNQKILCETMHCVGMVYTPADKSSSPREFMKLSEVTFLKRSFAKDERGKYMAPLDLPTILEMIQWTKLNSTRDEFNLVVDTCLRELSLHTPEVWATWAPRIHEAALERLDYRCISADQRTLRRIVAETDVYY